MPFTRMISTTTGQADFGVFDDLKPGDLFIVCPGLNEENTLDVADVAEHGVPFMKVDSRVLKSDKGYGVSIETGYLKYFDAECKVMVLHQRNMWELWA